MSQSLGFEKILAAVDFSKSSDAALQQAIRLARQCGAKLTLVHALPNLRTAILSASAESRFDLFYGEGDELQREIREESNARMRYLVNEFHATDLPIQCETILGDPSIAIIHAVQAEKHDLVIVGTRGLSTWEQMLIGSTAKRLIRKCPAPVWAVKSNATAAPRKILVATDFSDVSRRAAVIANQLAILNGAELHLLHVINSRDVPRAAVEKIAPGGTVRDEINEAAATHLEEFVNACQLSSQNVKSHLSFGLPAQEISRIAAQLEIDLLVVGTVGRSGIKGVVLGNTAEMVLNVCNCSILTMKPQDFVSPIEPPFWPLHPDEPTPVSGPAGQ